MPPQQKGIMTIRTMASDDNEQEIISSVKPVEEETDRNIIMTKTPDNNNNNNTNDRDGTNQNNHQEAVTPISPTRRGLRKLRNLGLRRRVNRSRSAPPIFNRKKSGRSLIQQHFKICKDNHVLLPGVPIHDDDLARDVHDFFNLIVLVPIVVLNGLNWNWDKLLYGAAKVVNIPFLHAWTGEYFQPFFWTTVAYFLTDLVWVCVIPKCVKSPSTIVQHHVAVFIYLIIPYWYPQFRFLMGVCMSVELNTWFLIARRVFNKQGLPPWKCDIPYFISLRVKLISILFYITWIVIRCMIYPYVLYVLAFPLMKNKKYADGKTPLCMAILLQSVFCFLNLQWSVQLLNSKIRQWKKGGKTRIASGL